MQPKKILTDERLSCWRRSDKIWREMLKQLNPETNVKSFQSGEKKILTSNPLHKYDWADLEPAVFPASSEIFFWASNEIAEWT